MGGLALLPPPRGLLCDRKPLPQGLYSAACGEGNQSECGQLGLDLACGPRIALRAARSVQKGRIQL